MQECDLGQQSILHAVKVPPRRRKLELNTTETINELSSELQEDLNDSGSKPLNETLSDLSLNEIGDNEITSSTGI